jgi:hypothetical protein
MCRNDGQRLVYFSARRKLRIGIDTIDRAYCTVADGDGQTKGHAKQPSMWVATQDLPRSAAHPSYMRLNQILDSHDFDGYVEGLCHRFYADDGRPGLPPGRYFRLLLIGYLKAWTRSARSGGGRPIRLRCASLSDCCCRTRRRTTRRSRARVA